MGSPQALDAATLIGHRLVLHNAVPQDQSKDAKFMPWQHQKAAYYREHVSDSDLDAYAWELSRRRQNWQNGKQAMAAYEKTRREAYKSWQKSMLGLRYLFFTVEKSETEERRELYLQPKHVLDRLKWLTNMGPLISARAAEGAGIVDLYAGCPPKKPKYADYTLDDPMRQALYPSDGVSAKQSLIVLEATIAHIQDPHKQGAQVQALGLRLEGMEEMGWLMCSYSKENEDRSVGEVESYDVVLTTTAPSYCL